MRNFKLLLLLLTLYLYLYNPIFQLLGFGLIKLILAFSIIYLFVFPRTLSALFISKFKIDIAFLFLIVFYLFLSQVWATQPLGIIIYRHVIFFLESFVISLFIFVYFRDVVDIGSLEKYIVIIGTIAAIISVFLILNPSVNVTIRSSVIVDSLDSKDSFDLSYRGFSLSESSSFTYGIIQGLIFAICLFKINSDWRYGIPMPFLFLSILFNARIGFVPVLIGFFLLFFAGKIQLKFIVGFSMLFLLSIFVFIYSDFLAQNERSLEWGLSFFEDTYNFLLGKDVSSNYSALTERMWFMPETVSGFLFGEGVELFKGDRVRTDVGYVIQIFRGGLFYVFFLLAFLFYDVHRFRLLTKTSFHSVLFFTTLLISNYKGEILFVPNGVMRLLALYYVFYLFSAPSFYRLTKIKFKV